MHSRSRVANPLSRGKKLTLIGERREVRTRRHEQHLHSWFAVIAGFRGFSRREWRADLTNGARSTLDPCVDKAQLTQGKHTSSDLSPSSLPADRAWSAYDWGGPVTLRSWYSERISIQYHIKNTSRRRRGGAEWVPGGSNELWPYGLKVCFVEYFSLI
jgi:hypothetical protein